MAKKRRIRSPHPGVKLKRRERASGDVWRAHYLDPDTGKEAAVTLDPFAIGTAEARRGWAIALARQLAQRRMERARGVEPEPERMGIGDAVALYLDSARVRLAPKTVQTYELAIERLRRWAAEERVEATADLTPGRLAGLRDAIISAPKRTADKGGKRGRRKPTAEPRSPVSINRELRTLATILTAWRRRGLVHVSSDQIADAMRRLPVERELPVFLTPADLKRLLAAVLRHDAETFDATREEHAGRRPAGSTARYPALAPFTAFLALTGCRRGEALSLRWSDVDLDALDSSGAAVGEIRLRAADVKTRTARIVGCEVSPALRKILAALRLRSGGSGRVFANLTADAVESARARLVTEYGAPAFTWQVLRSTCATYLVNAPGIFGSASAFMAARQLGHSVVVSERRYAGQLRGLSRDARSLEAAMRIEGELAGVLDACATRPASAAASVRGAPWMS